MMHIEPLYGLIDYKFQLILCLSSYREIGGQKDYAVFGHCVIQCP